MQTDIDQSRRAWLKNVAAAASTVAVAQVMSSCHMRPTDTAMPTVDDDRPWPDADAIVGALPEQIDCVECGFCMPCPYGVEIPTMFSLYNSALADGRIPRSVTTLQSEAGLKRASAFLDDAVEQIGDRHIAHRCLCCGQCQPNCPMEIKIAANMRKIGNLIDLIREQQCL